MKKNHNWKTPAYRDIVCVCVIRKNMKKSDLLWTEWPSAKRHQNSGS